TRWNVARARSNASCFHIDMAISLRWPARREGEDTGDEPSTVVHPLVSSSCTPTTSTPADVSRVAPGGEPLSRRGLPWAVTQTRRRLLPPLVPHARSNREE